MTGMLIRELVEILIRIEDLDTMVHVLGDKDFSIMMNSYIIRK